MTTLHSAQRFYTDSNTQGPGTSQVLDGARKELVFTGSRENAEAISALLNLGHDSASKKLFMTMLNGMNETVHSAVIKYLATDFLATKHASASQEMLNRHERERSQTTR